MPFLFLTQDQQDDDLAAAIEGREREIANYDLNSGVFRKVLENYASLPEEWPASIAPHKGQDSNAAALVLSGDTLDLFNQYAYRDQIRHLLKTNDAEREKSRKVYEALIASIPADRLDAAVQRLKQKQG